ncbi:MAG TPA: tetratricopeptide repeat protein, partial [Adhaeribacter sp.]|nr:tetratricopeptide repeat protein [Adhaeribacter sp.]
EEKNTLTPRQAAISRIDSVENSIRSSIKKQEDPDVTLAMKAIRNYTYFAADFPRDTLSPGYLFKAAQLYEGVLRDLPKAAQIYGDIYKLYPDYKNRPMMLFHQGNTLIDMQDTSRASLKLRTFIRDYPKHPFADDAAGLLKLMHMTPEQMEAYFQRSAQEQGGSVQNK